MCIDVNNQPDPTEKLKEYVTKQLEAYFPTCPTIKKKQVLYKTRATFWAIDQSIPFVAFSEPSFREMFVASLPC